MEIRGVNLNVQITGSGTPFIWAHELLGNIEEESGNNFFKFESFPPTIKLIRYDVRGHGKSAPVNKREDYHFQNLAEDMLAVADAVGVNQFIAGGMSLGAATTLWAALHAPERIKGIVLVAPGTAWESRVSQSHLYRLIAYAGGILGGKVLIRLRGRRASRLPAWLAEAEPDTIAGIRQGISSLSRKSIWNLFHGLAESDLPPRQRIIELIDIPAIILTWTDDLMHPVGSAYELHRLMPKSELFVAQGYEEFQTIPKRLRDFVLTYTETR